MNAKIEPLTASEVPLFLRAIVEYSPEYYPVFLCAIHTGMCSGEIAGLQWIDINFNGKYLVVRRSFKNGKVSPKKTNKIRRDDLSDELSDDLIATLLEIRRERREAYLAKGKHEIPEWVFCNRQGEAVNRLPSLSSRRVVADQATGELGNE